MLDLESTASTSSERRREPGRAWRTPAHDATTSEPTERPHPALSRPTREVAAPYHSETGGIARVRRRRSPQTPPRVSGLPLPLRGELGPFIGMQPRAAAQARPTARRSFPASTFRPACSYRSACRSASAALRSRVSATRRNIDASRAARIRVSPTARRAAAPEGSTASEPIAPEMVAHSPIPPLRVQGSLCHP